MDTIIYGIMNGINKMGPLQLPSFLLAFNNPVSNKIPNAFQDQHKPGWTYLLVGRLNYKFLTAPNMYSHIKHLTEAFHCLAKKSNIHTECVAAI